ncbi:MAG TPA: hypothetical protein VGN82_18230 [Bosea sp. (in: a-proteobacteria)]|jgi:hypothetical protein|uniref:hypothetical protein n=1 Tax=Bosea sp. (in: a-proteobacteria) TaxID=1871050 RepID=UPI002E0F25B4|nr:hypothetical protein [Bosea sp. (in: a-proteobacteria)]
MTRSGEKTPSPPSSPASRGQPQKPARGPANSEAFGRFVRNLARLEGGPGRLGKAGAEKCGEGVR